MTQESEYRPIIIPTEVQTSPKRWQQCGALIAKHLNQGSDLLLDVDGVLCKPDSLDRPELTTIKIVTSIRKLENLEVKVGVATARSIQIIDYLRNEHDLRMEGPTILEDGQMLIRNGNTEFLTLPNHSAFIADARQEFAMLYPEFQNSWQVTKMLSELGIFTLSRGNFQWQGICSAYFWFFAHKEIDKDREILTSIFEPTLRALAQKNDLDFERDLVVSVDRMSVGNLGILGIKGKINGEPINKGTAGRRLTQSWIFAADGFGDTNLGKTTKEKNGIVIGIGGNLDISNEPPEFLRSADFVLDNPEELTLALSYAAICLEK